MSPSCRVNRSSSSALSSRRARSAMRCTSCRLRLDTIRQFYRTALSKLHPRVFIEEPAVAGESAGGDLRAQRGERGGAVVADRKVIEDQGLDVGAPADVDRLLGRGGDGFAAIGFAQERRVVDEHIGVGDE